MIKGLIAYGTPDEIEWIEGEDNYFFQGFADKGSYPFQVIDGQFILGDEKETHCSSFVDFIAEHGWPNENIISPMKIGYDEFEWRHKPIIYKGEEDEGPNPIESVKYVKTNEGIDLQIIYKDGEEKEFEGLSIDEIKPDFLARDIRNDNYLYNHHGFYVINYTDDSDERLTYGELMQELSHKSVCQGRIFHSIGYDFICFWNNNYAKDAYPYLIKTFGYKVADFIFVPCEDVDDAKACYGKSGMPTYGEWLKGECNNFDNDKENALKEKFKAIHLANQKEKNNYFQDFRQNRGELQGQKLGKMTMAQYHNLIRQESKKNKKKIIKETINNYIKIMTSLN